MARQVMTRASKRTAAAACPAHEPGETSARVLALVEGYLESLRFERGFSQHTLRNYRIDLEAFLRWCARNDVDPLQATHRQLRA